MIRNKLKLGFTLGLFIILGTMNISAQNSVRNERHKTPPSFDELLEKMDENGDGQLSENEVKGPLKKDFSKIDTNKDGFISEEELKKAPKPKKRRKV